MKQPDKDDWGKLRHGLMYLKGTLHMKRYLTTDNLSNIVWWVDGSFGVHWDSRRHTKSMMSMGKGAIVNIARKHNMNVASSTESELVSIADVLGMILLCKYFMEVKQLLQKRMCLGKIDIMAACAGWRPWRGSLPPYFLIIMIVVVIALLSSASDRILSSLSNLVASFT